MEISAQVAGGRRGLYSLIRSSEDHVPKSKVRKKPQNQASRSAAAAAAAAVAAAGLVRALDWFPRYEP